MDNFSQQFLSNKGLDAHLCEIQSSNKTSAELDVVKKQETSNFTSSESGVDSSNWQHSTAIGMVQEVLTISQKRNRRRMRNRKRAKLEKALQDGFEKSRCAEELRLFGSRPSLEKPETDVPSISYPIICTNITKREGRTEHLRPRDPKLFIKDTRIIAPSSSDCLTLNDNGIEMGRGTKLFRPSAAGSLLKDPSTDISGQNQSSQNNNIEKDKGTPFLKKQKTNIPPSNYLVLNDSNIKVIGGTELLGSIGATSFLKNPRTDISQFSDHSILSTNNFEKDMGSKRLRPIGPKLLPNQPTTDIPASSNHPIQSIKIAIVKDSFPLDILSQDEADLIQKDILQKIDKISVGHCLPKIQDSRLNLGALVFRCEDDPTVKWIKKKFEGNRQVLGDATLKVLKANELRGKPIKMAFKTKYVKNADPGLLLSRINRFNPELKTEKWRVLQRIVDPLSIRLIFEVDFDIGEAIRKANYGAYTGLDWGKFKVIRDPFAKKRLKKIEKGNQASTSQILPGPLPQPVNEISHPFQPTTTSAPISSNPSINMPKTTSLPPPKPSLLGDRPPAMAPLPPPPAPVIGSFPERADPHIGDQDLRMPPVGDHDMRPPPMTGDKDMRHLPMGDQDLRKINVPPVMPENRAFNDPRHRNIPRLEMVSNRGPVFDRSRPSLPPDVRPGFDGRGVGVSLRMENPRGVNMPSIPNISPGRMPPVPPRMSPASSGSPLIGGASPNAMSSPRPVNNPIAATATAIAPHDQEKAALIVQVLQLTDQQIALLPPEQRQSIMVLKEQIARSHQTP